MEANVLIEAAKFMILGMSVVFFFLTIMVYAIKLQAKLVAKYFSMSAVIHHEHQNKKGNE